MFSDTRVDYQSVTPVKLVIAELARDTSLSRELRMDLLGLNTALNYGNCLRNAESAFTTRPQMSFYSSFTPQNESTCHLGFFPFDCHHWVYSR